MLFLLEKAKMDIGKSFLTINKITESSAKDYGYK